MTNERLAALIAEGGNDELLPLLWERMQRFYRMSSKKYANAHAERCTRYGVNADDIFQESYFAMLDSVKYYGGRKSEQQALKFISFCGLPFKNHAAGLIGLRNKSLDVIESSTILSLDEQVPGKDGEPDTPRSELVPDPDSLQPFYDVENADYCRAIRETVAAQPLTETERNVINYIYFKGYNNTQTGEIIGISIERVRQCRNSAIRKLQKSREMRCLFIDNPYRHISLSEFRRYGSIVEQITEKREERKKVL